MRPQTFGLHFDDDGSHCSGNSDPFHNHGRTINIGMDGLQAASVWGDFGEEIRSNGAYTGDFMRSYVFAPVDTTGLSVAPSIYQPV